MKVVGDGLGFNREEVLEMLDSLFKGKKRFHVLEVSDVVAHEHIRAAGKRKGVFQLSPAGKDHFEIERKLDGKGNIAPRSPQDIRPALEGSDHRIVAAHVNVPIMEEKKVRDFGKPVAGLFIRVSDGFITHVPAGHDQTLE